MLNGTKDLIHISNSSFRFIVDEKVTLNGSLYFGGISCSNNIIGMENISLFFNFNMSSLGK